MRRSIIVFSLAAGCSFVDDFDKFRAADDVVVPKDDSGVVPDDAGKDATTPRDGTVPTVDAGKDAAPTLIDADLGDADLPVDAGVDTAVPACAATCVDDDPCTFNSCDGAGACTFPLIDGDGDGYSPAVCKAGSTLRGGDCDDGNAMRRPDLAESCDDVDNDCDGMVDEGFNKTLCFQDRDMDGFPNLKLGSIPRCGVCMPGEIAVIDPTDTSRDDCYDVDDEDGPNVHPGQKNYDDHGYGPGGRDQRSFDYDCNGMIDRSIPSLPGSCGGLLSLLCSGEAGFEGEQPACGETGTYRTCGANGLNCMGTTQNMKQLCK